MGLISGPKPAPYPWETSFWNNDIYRRAAENIVRRKATEYPDVNTLFDEASNAKFHDRYRDRGYQQFNNDFNAKRGLRKRKVR